jgi:pyridoxine kinase
VRQVVAADIMRAMLDHVAGHGWLDGLAAVMTGYFVDAGQVEAAGDAIAVLKAAHPGLVFLCDPIIGDDEPGLYVAPEVAQAIRSRLVPMADIIAPNRFELAWLAGAEVTGPDSAVQAGRGLAPLCLATSIPAAEGRLATMAIASETAWLVETCRRRHVPHGTGDLLSGLFLAHMLAGSDGREALGLSLATVEAVLDASHGSDALDLAAGLVRPAGRLSVRALETLA